jgi:DNA-binding NarL/FixJ family response regulator
LGEEAFAAAWAAGCALPPEQAVAEVLAGRAATPPTRAPRVPASPAPRPAAEPVALTAREREIAALLARGLTNRQIADELVVSERTAEWHVANVLGKLGLESRSQVALWLSQQQSTSVSNA